MRFTIVSKTGYENNQVTINLEKYLLSKKYIKNDFDPEIVFVIGGDGTFLKTFNYYVNKDISPIYFVINAGRLGHLSTLKLVEFNKFNNKINEIIDNSKQYNYLEAIVNNEKIYALNEIRIENKNSSAISFEIYIDGNLFEIIRGDGIIVASTLGSSGINKSLNGPLVDTTLEVLIMTEKASISNKFYNSLKNSFILSKDHEISIKPISNDYILYYDNSTYVEPFKEVKIKLSNSKIKIASKEDVNFIKKIKESFL